MGMKIRLAETRGRIASPRTNKIVSYRSFDCMSYHSAEYPSWDAVDTINDDRTEPGFVTEYHSHQGLDILSYVIKGSVHHKDNLGNDHTAVAGQIQHMSCGSGIWHTEGNDSDANNRYLQIWLRPRSPFTEPPRYALINRPHEFSRLDVDLYDPAVEVWVGWLRQDIRVADCYILVLEGFIHANDHLLYEGDALDTGGDPVDIRVNAPAHIILFKKI